MTQLRSALLVVAVLLVMVANHAAAAVGVGEAALWLRYPALSPDGSTIVFSYRGDLWRVAAGGGQAVPLTVHAAHDSQPVWSPDGRLIAFASDRYGNLDVFVMPAAGGEATRLTFHSADDEPTSFTADGTAVLFSSGRLDRRDCVQFPSRGAQPELYRVALTGGMPVRVLTTPALYAVEDGAGRRLVYSDQKGLESEWRKHDDSSFARDVWLVDVASGSHTRLTDFGADDRQPVWGPDFASLYYLSERSGSFNVWRLALANGAAPEQVTDHAVHPVRFLSASRAGDLCYAFDGEIWLRPAGEAVSRKVAVAVAVDTRHNATAWADVAQEITEYELSPNGKEIAFVARGEVFVTATEHGDTRRITDTPEQERSVSFSPDGRSLLYAGERNGSWNLYRADLVDAAEPSFFNATAIAEKAILEGAAETFQPRFSPDGREVAFLEDRTSLRVLDLASGAVRTIVPATANYSYSDGDQWYEWSPDGKWFLVEYLSPTRWSSEVGLVPVAGGDIVNLTKSGYEDVRPRWGKDGDVMYWFTDRHGDRLQAGWPAEYDVYAAFLTRAAWETFRLSPAEMEQQKEREKKAKKEKKGDKGKDDGKGKDDDKEEDEDADRVKPVDPVAIELAGLEDRTLRLSLHSANVADARVTPDGEKLLYLAKFEEGFDLWIYEHRKKEIKLLAKLKADSADRLTVDRDGKKAFVLADHQVKAVEIESGKVTPVQLEAKMRLDAAAERAYLFEHAWRQTAAKFYVADLHGVDWAGLKAAYARFLPHVDNNWDFAELISELQGELNASHLGCYYRPSQDGADATASLGIFPDETHTGAGVAVAEVIEGGPFHNSDTRLARGTVIESVDGTAIAAGANWYPLLNRTAGRLIRVGLLDPATGTRWQETVKPITLAEESELLYQRWLRSRRAEVERLSGGRLGYAHIRTMSDGRYREVFEQVFGRAVAKDGIVLDTRFNNGGNLVEALTIFLTGEVYARATPRGRQIGDMPSYRWTRPSIVVMNEGNYSDAHCFPAAYSALGIGEMVGMPVPGTCTSVWWEKLQDRSLVFGIPEVGYLDNQGELLENKHLAPEHLVDNDPALEAGGRDQQLEKAVEVLLSQLDRNAAP